MSRGTPLPIHSSDGVGRLACPPVDRGCPAPPRDLPADAASVLTPEVLDRDTAADMAGSIVASIFEHFRRQRRPTVIDVDSVACALLPLAALPPVWQVVTVGIVASVFVGGCLLLLFLPRGRRQACDDAENEQVPDRFAVKVGGSVCRVARGFQAEPTRDLSHAPHSIRTASRIDRTAGGYDVETPAVRVFVPGVGDE
jgi:hypothetical protein